jgi:hypothetical protein
LRFLSGIDGSARYHLQRGQAGHEKIVAASQFDKVGQIGTDERRILRIGRSLQNALAPAFVISDHQVFVVSLMQVISVFDPLLLNEFELAEQTGIQGHKNNAVFVLIANWLTLWHVSSVSQPAAHDAPAIYQVAVESK